VAIARATSPDPSERGPGCSGRWHSSGAGQGPRCSRRTASSRPPGPKADARPRQLKAEPEVARPAALYLSQDLQSLRLLPNNLQAIDEQHHGRWTEVFPQRSGGQRTEGRQIRLGQSPAQLSPPLVGVGAVCHLPHLLLPATRQPTSPVVQSVHQLRRWLTCGSSSLLRREPVSPNPGRSGERQEIQPVCFPHCRSRLFPRGCLEPGLLQLREHVLVTAHLCQVRSRLTHPAAQLLVGRAGEPPFGRSSACQAGPSQVSGAAGSPR